MNAGAAPDSSEVRLAEPREKVPLDSALSRRRSRPKWIHTCNAWSALGVQKRGVRPVSGAGASREGHILTDDRAGRGSSKRQYPR